MTATEEVSRRGELGLEFKEREEDRGKRRIRGIAQKGEDDLQALRIKKVGPTLFVFV